MVRSTPAPMQKLCRSITLSLLLGGALAAGCAHHHYTKHAELAPIPGVSNRPFTGVPWYLEPAQASVPPVRAPSWSSQREPVVGGAVPHGTERDRLRALLAAADAEIVLVGESQTPDERRALALTVDEIAERLKPYPDIAAEADELRELTRALPTTRAIDLPRVKKRMGQLTDLIRLQLLAGS